MHIVKEQMCYQSSFWFGPLSEVCGWEKRDADKAGESSLSQTKNFI